MEAYLELLHHPDTDMTIWLRDCITTETMVPVITDLVKYRLNGVFHNFGHEEYLRTNFRHSWRLTFDDVANSDVDALSISVACCLRFESFNTPVRVHEWALCVFFVVCLLTSHHSLRNVSRPICVNDSQQISMYISGGGGS